MSKPMLKDKHTGWPSNEDVIVYFATGFDDTFQECLEAYLAAFPTVEPNITNPYLDYFSFDVRNAIRHIPKYKRVVASLYKLHQLRRTGAINIDIVEETA